MNKPARPSLDSRISDQVVDANEFVAWFNPFPGCYDTLNPRLTAEDVIGLCGPSRTRGKAGAAMVSRLVTLAATGHGTTARDVAALGAVLGLGERQLAKRRSGEYHYADAWLAGDEDRIDGPSKGEMVAVQVIAGVRDLGVGAGTRLAIYDLVDWYRFREQLAPPVVINALAVVVGLVDAETGEPDAHRMKLLLGHDHYRLRQSAVADAEHRASSGQRLRLSEHQERFSTSAEDEDIMRSLQAMRGDKGGAYSVVEEREHRRLTADERLKAQAAELINPGEIFRRYNAAKPPQVGRSLYGLRAKYWQLWLARKGG